MIKSSGSGASDAVIKYIDFIHMSQKHPYNKKVKIKIKKMFFLEKLPLAY